jgi:hypothetical protein
MLRSPLGFAGALTSLTLLAACGGGGTPSNAVQTGGTGANTATSSGGNSAAGSGMPQAGNGPSGAGGSSVAGSNGSSVAGAGGGNGVAGSGGNSSSIAGSGGSVAGSNSTPNGGSTSAAGSGTGGSNSGGAGGSNGGAGGNGTSGGGSNTGGSAGGAGGTSGAGGANTMAGNGPTLDQNGKANAAPGQMTSTPLDYLRLGEIRILNNNWGSQELNCNTPMSVFVNQNSNFGWNFNRGDCDTANSKSKPDFPQIEFGIHPFGIGHNLVTSPEFSSTTLLPIQLKDVASASVSVQNLTATFQRESSWNITFEFWISQRHPVTDPNPGVYAELMTFWGWENGRWPSPPDGSGPTGTGAGDQVPSGGKTYTLWVQDDQWANGQWRYFQFRADDGPQKAFNGTLNVKPFIDYLVNTRKYSPEFWITRLEIGSEIDDDTQGTVQMSGITFEVNGQSRSAVIGGN